MIERDERAAVVHSGSTRELLEAWVDNVVESWRDHWRGRDDHRYGVDFAAFLGERFLTDFALRDRVRNRDRA